MDAHLQTSATPPKSTAPRGTLRRPTDADLIAFCEENESLVLATISFDGAEIVDCTSFKTLFKLINWRGSGGEICIPESATKKHALVKMIGQQNAATLVQKFGRGPIQLPSKKKILRLYCRAKAIELDAQGYSRTAIARALDIHPRTVSRYRAGQ